MSTQPYTSTPHFSASELSGASSVFEGKLTAHPLLALFPREVHDGDTVEIPVKVSKATAAPFASWDGPSDLAPGEDTRVLRGKPVPIREKSALTNREISFFRRYNELKQVAAGTQTVLDLATRRNRAIAEHVQYLLRRNSERKHIMCATALQGTVSFSRNGATVSESIGTDTITAPGTTFDNASAKIIEQLYRIFDEFENGDGANVEAANTPCDTVVFSSRMFAKYFAKNTDFLDYVKASPALTQQFIGSDGRPGLMEPTSPFMFLDRIWVPVTGSWTSAAGVVTPRWPLNTLSLLALRSDGQRVLEHAAVRDEYCPTGMPNWRAWMSNDPIHHYAEYADNIIPVVRVRERVKQCVVGA